jgi:hypothetical protein
MSLDQHRRTSIAGPASPEHKAAQPKLIMKVRHRGRHGTGHSVRLNAINSWFQVVPVEPDIRIPVLTVTV